MQLGYARISTDTQDSALQLDALKKTGCERLFEDTLSGATKTKDRPGFRKLVEQARRGDKIVVWRLDRLGRNTIDVLETVEALKASGIELASITENIDTTTPTGQFFFTVMAAMSEMERKTIKARVRAGLDAAKERGRIGGRPQAGRDKLDMVASAIKGGADVASACKAVSVSRATFYRAVKEGRVAAA